MTEEVFEEEEDLDKTKSLVKAISSASDLKKSLQGESECACAAKKKVNKPVDVKVQEKEKAAHKVKAEESIAKSKVLREEANKLVTEAVTSKATAEKNAAEVVKRAKEATDEAYKAEEEVKRMEAAAGKCCGCVDNSCAPHKNIKISIKTLDETIAKQEAMWSMVKSLKKSFEQQQVYVKKITQQSEDIREERERLEVNYERSKSIEIKKRLESTIRIEEAIKKTLSEAISQKETILTQEKVTKEKAK